MRLEKIVLDGFKSFADKTEFTFDTPITAIVGPNGCGKSNIVDAVKWVLGEQSAKSLRSGQMADVIFSGSSSRKPMGAAEVSLFISDTTGWLPIEADEIQISRKIYKSGESEYRINSKLCRLKDIRELFMDTGIGTRAYSILEQGQIEQLISASKTDRRFIFEEAAGISKYKAHKKEALRKLEHTEQNLLRLADILGEVEKQLRSVKLQAGKARNYLQYNQRLKELQVKYWLAEFDKIKTQMTRKQTNLEQLQQHFELLTTELARNEALISNLAEDIVETENKINRTDNSLVTVQSRIEQQLQRIEFLRTRMTELLQRRQTASQRITKLHRQQELFENDLSRLNSELVNCEKMLDEKNRAAEQTQKQIQQISEECASLQADLEDEKSGIIDVVRRTAQLHNELQSISVYRHNLSSQKDRLIGRAEETKTELEKLLTEKAQHNARRSDIEKVLGQLQQRLESKLKEMTEVNNILTADAKRLATNREVLSALNSELAVLKDMQRRHEGLKAGVKDILKRRSNQKNKLDYLEEILAEIITADVEHANAVEAALEGLTDALVINDTNKLLADTETMEKLQGRADFLCLDRIEPFVDKEDFSRFPQVKGRLVEFVNTESKYHPLTWKLLGKTIVVDSIHSAIEIAEKTGDGYEFVTLKGQLLTTGRSWRIKLGPLGKATGLISRKSRLHQLQNTINNISTELTQIEERIEKNNQTKAHLTKLCQDLRTAIYEANTEKMQVDSKVTFYEQNIKRLKDEEPLIASEIDLLEEQIAHSVQKEYDSKQKLQELEAVNSQRTAHIQQLESRYAEQKQKQQALVDKLTDLKVSLGQIAEHQHAVKQTITSLQHQMQENHTATDASQKEVNSCDEQWLQAQRDVLGSEAAVSELFVEKERSEQVSQNLHGEIKTLLEEQKRIEQLIRQKRMQISQIEQEINELKIELGQLQIKAQTLTERVQEQLQIDLLKAYEGYRDQEIDWDRVGQEISELRHKIDRLGNINLGAIDEQESLEKRYEFLSSQVEDLNSSRAQLQQLINRLNRTSREKFRQTFEEIRVHFQQIFRKLFGGGKADILLEDTEDILEAGIEVIARPPGKETRTISLLSGGEKSLTALALLFAVFRTKPSPFCFLDEVDAALDEANNERFNMLLKEFQKDSQFIIITHSKRTMSIADVLVGITMQLRGVSKKISVRFDEYDQAAPAVA